LVRGVLTGSVDDLRLLLIRYAPRIIKNKDVPNPQLDNFSSRLVPIEHYTSAFDLVGERCPCCENLNKDGVLLLSEDNLTWLDGQKSDLTKMHVELVVAKREDLEAQLRPESHEVFEANIQHWLAFFNIDPLDDGILDLAYAICIAVNF
jgi:hypothetical protein